MSASAISRITNLNRTAIALYAIAMLVAAPVQSPAQTESEVGWAYVGTYTRPRVPPESGKSSQGIYRLSIDRTTGQLHTHGLAAESVNPSFLAVHPFRDIVYAVNETNVTQKSSSGANVGGVTAFRIERGTGRLVSINRRPTSGGAACHINVDRTGRFVLIANYGGGNVTVIGLADEGALLEQTDLEQHTGHSIDPKRQQSPHAHSIDLDPSNDLVFSADLGLDKILIYRFNAKKGTLDAVGAGTVAPGSGPRHCAIHGPQKCVYVINELTSTITAFRMDAERGTLTEIQTVSTLPADFTGINSAAEIQISAAGQFVYCSNRWHDSIAVFKVASDSGKLALVQHQSTLGKTPRHFTIEPTGRFLVVANQDSDNVVAFEIDQTTGQLKPCGQPVEVPSPVCVRFVTESPSE